MGDLTRCPAYEEAACLEDPTCTWLPSSGVCVEACKMDTSPGSCSDSACYWDEVAKSCSTCLGRPELDCISSGCVWTDGKCSRCDGRAESDCSANGCVWNSDKNACWRCP